MTSRVSFTLTDPSRVEGRCDACGAVFWVQPGHDSRHAIVDCIQSLAFRLNGLEEQIETDQ